MSNASGPSARATCSVRPSSRLTPRTHVGRAHDGRAPRAIADRLLLRLAQAGRADHVRGAVRGGERDVRGGRSGRGELDQHVGRVDQARRIVTGHEPRRITPRERAEVLTQRRMIALVHAAAERASLGREHFADHRSAHATGAAQNTDPHARLPRRQMRGSMRAPVLLSSQPRQSGSVWLAERLPQLLDFRKA